jgi:hypothetical protein
MFAVFYLCSWIVIGFGLDFQSILKSGFGFVFSIIFLCWIWIGLTIQKKIGLSKSLVVVDALEQLKILSCLSQILQDFNLIFFQKKTKHLACQII